MKKHMSKDQLLFKMKTEQMAYLASGRAVKLIALIVLHEQYHFNAEQCKEFLERFEDVLDYYNKSKEYTSILEEWDEYFEQEIGERILWKEGDETH